MMRSRARVNPISMVRAFYGGAEPFLGGLHDELESELEAPPRESFVSVPMSAQHVNSHPDLKE
ncbi:MAG: hypothetical protein VYA84_08720 [Planctomycetota bacterium]|nr:hypothetical protein [Planctomycetota bacterium]